MRYVFMCIVTLYNVERQQPIYIQYENGHIKFKSLFQCFSTRFYFYYISWIKEERSRFSIYIVQEYVQLAGLFGKSFNSMFCQLIVLRFSFLPFFTVSHSALLVTFPTTFFLFNFFLFIYRHRQQQRVDCGAFFFFSSCYVYHMYLYRTSISFVFFTVNFIAF